MTRVLTIAEIEKLDCPAINSSFKPEEILSGVRDYLAQTLSVERADGPTVFAFAYAKYESVSIHSSMAFERALREYRAWNARGTFKGPLPAYVGSFFKEWLKQEVAKVA